MLNVAQLTIENDQVRFTLRSEKLGDDSQTGRLIVPSACYTVRTGRGNVLFLFGILSCDTDQLTKQLQLHTIASL